MEKPLKCILLLSLKQIALRRVAVILWSDWDILAAISKFQFFGLNAKNEKEWRETIEGKIIAKLLKFKLPETLKEQMKDIVERIGIDIRKWKARHQEYFDELYRDNCLPHSVELFFTTAGMIDYIKTAEGIVCCDVFLLVQRYKIACLYCLDDYIPLLWGELSKEWKEYFSTNKDLSPSLPLFKHHILTGDLFKLDDLMRTSDRIYTSFNQFAFEHSIETGNKTAAEYFFLKLSHSEREDSLMRSTDALLGDPNYDDNFLTKRLSELLCYLLSVMTPGQQMETIKAHPQDVLLCFLDFPLQDFFLENSSLLWNSLPSSSHLDLLWKMSTRFSYPGHYVPKLFQEFFIQSPLDLKMCFVGESSDLYRIPACRFLSVFLECEDLESIKVMFRNLEEADRVKLLFGHEVLKLLCHGIRTGRWPRVEMCLREAMLSKEDRGKLKETFMEILSVWNKGQIEWRNPKWRRFFQFFDENGDVDSEEKTRIAS